MAPITAPVTYKNEVTLAPVEDLSALNAGNVQYATGGTQYSGDVASYNQQAAGATTSSYQYSASYQLPTVTSQTANYASYNVAGASYV